MILGFSEALQLSGGFIIRLDLEFVSFLYNDFILSPMPYPNKLTLQITIICIYELRIS